MQAPSRNEFRPGVSFDPVCGALLKQEDTNQFFDGERTHYFCCAMCRRIFIDEWRATETAKLSPGRCALMAGTRSTTGPSKRPTLMSPGSAKVRCPAR